MRAARCRAGAPQIQQLDAKAKPGTFRPVATFPTGAPTMAIAKGTPAEQKNLDVAKELDKVWETKKVDAILAFMSPDATVEDYTMPAALKGTKVQKPMLETMFKAIPDMKSEISVRIAADDIVATEHTDTGTLKGNMGPIKATNKPVTLHMVDIAQIKDGKITAVWAYANTMEMIPPPAAAPAKDAKPAAAPAKDAKPAQGKDEKGAPAKK